MSATPVFDVIIADDQTMVAEGISALLQQHSDFNVIGICSDGEELMAMLHTAQPHLILLDLNMPVLDGFETCRMISEKYPQIFIVALTMYDNERFKQRIKAAGAAGMLLKYTSSDQLAKMLRKIMASAKGVDFIVSEIAAKKEPSTTIDNGDRFLIQYKISDREFEIIRLIAEGLNSEQIAQQLFLSEHTINTHRKNILERLQVKNTAELINLMHKSDLL